MNRTRIESLNVESYVRVSFVSSGQSCSCLGTMADDEDNSSTGNQKPIDAKHADADADLLKNALSFLQHPDVQDESDDKKRAFLQTKGLSDTVIDQAISRTTRKEDDIEVMRKGETTHWAGGQKPASEQSPPEDSAPGNAPIITYPEFLQHSRQSQPLVTASGLLTSAYAIAGASAVLYGAGKFLVQPMVESLVAARQSLAETASTNLSVLNEKLEANVSTLPEPVAGQQDHDEDENEPNASSYFSRTTGTQTSPHTLDGDLTSRQLVTGSPSQTDQQAEKLSSVHTSLEQLRGDGSSEEAIQSSIEDLRNFLNQLPRSVDLRPVARYGSAWGGPKNDDAISRVQAEIKGVKGALLSARNFPSSVMR